MKKETVGVITQTGGFSRLIKDAMNSDEPIFIELRGKTVAMVVRCDDASMRMMNDSLSYGKLLGQLEHDGSDELYGQYLVTKVMEGLIAELLLVGSGNANVVEHMKSSIISNMKVQQKEAGSAGTQPVASVEGNMGAGAVKRSSTRNKKK